ncbi:MAG TPA: SRPBCC domain-containing protein [Solirubrobacteraceae bacterium]|jgi:carbon monoxide dehydrogenase subunit G|nr:SRPBCC domain-containing protein [Solirubrobacteraceae bacterium]
MSAVSGSSTVAAEREGLWDVLSDPARLGAALPGVEDVSVEDSTHFSAVAHPSTALGATRIQMDFEILEERRGEYVRIAGSGRAGENRVELNVELELTDAPGGGTAASWRGELMLRGVLRSLLQRGAGAIFNEQVEAVLAAGAAEG